MTQDGRNEALVNKIIVAITCHKYSHKMRGLDVRPNAVLFSHNRMVHTTMKIFYFKIA